MSLICIQTFFIFSLCADGVCIVSSIKVIIFISVLISVWSPKPYVCFLPCVLFLLITFSCCISPLSCSVCLLFEVNVWLIFELLPDSLLVFSCYSILGFCASNFPEIICGSFATFANKQWHILNISKTFGNLFKA